MLYWIGSLGCATCSGPGDDQCLTCSPGYILAINKCIYCGDGIKTGE